VAVFKLVAGSQAMRPSDSPPHAAAAEPAVERRAPGRPKNVSRFPAKAEPKPAAEPQARAKTGTGDEWSEF